MIRTQQNPARLAGATDVVVIGAGHAGLAMSYLLSRRGIDHVVLERGEIANSWRHERWDSLRLLTPNWQTRLPGRAYAGDEPDSFMSMAELIRFIEDYAEFAQAPVRTGTRVTSVRREDSCYRVDTNRGSWVSHAVVIATGACNAASVPAFAADVPAHVVQLTPPNYRGPDQVEEGGVLVVGASASGLQLADELLRAGRDVTLAASEHVRMPRRYRGKDIFYWLQQSGIHDETYSDVEDVERGRRLPSPQLVGAHDRHIFDLNSLTEQGAALAGRMMGIRDGVALFSGSLRNVCALADLKMQRLLRRIDETADAEAAPAAEAFAPTRVPDDPPLTVDLDARGIRTIIWATGFRPDYSWLDVPVLDRKGRLVHDGGVVASPGLYALGLPLMRRRKSSFIFGIEDDARDISKHLLNYLDSLTEDNSHGIYRHDFTRRGLRRSA